MIESNIYTKDKTLSRKNSYTDIVIHGNNKQYNLSTESIHDHLIKNDDVRTNLFSSNDDANTWSRRNPSNMWGVVMTQVQTSSWPCHKIRIGCSEILSQCTRRRKERKSFSRMIILFFFAYINLVFLNIQYVSYCMAMMTPILAS